MTIDNDKKFSDLMAAWGYALPGNVASKAYDKIVAHIDAQTERDRKDAMRYRWLRDNSVRRFDIRMTTDDKDDDGEAVRIDHQLAWSGMEAQFFDAAIDAELAKK